MATTNETPAQRNRRLAEVYANSNATLAQCNASARADEEALRAKTNDTVRVAQDAIARAFGGATSVKK